MTKRRAAREGYHERLSGNRKVTAFAQPVSRDRAVNSRIVPCPTCGAEVDVQCVTASGGRCTHASRRRMALRKLNEDYKVADCEYATFLGPRQRRAVRDLLEFGQAHVARMLNVAPATLRRWEETQCVITGPEGARYGQWLRDNAEAAQAVLAKIRAAIEEADDDA